MEKESAVEKDGFDSCCVDSMIQSSESISCRSRSSSDDFSSGQLEWPNGEASKCVSSAGQDNSYLRNLEDETMLKHCSKASEMEMMKERFAKLLLGEDMSGGGKGVCSALTISNAITNLCATVFGQLWRLEPLPSEKKSMWKREMKCLLSVSDYIVEFIPSLQTSSDGSKLEVMTCCPRSDLAINLPALAKLDNMLLEILDGFTNTEFWYVDQGIVATPESNGFKIGIQRDKEKWWLPLPRTAPDGLSDVTRKQLSYKRECASQILKAATSINSMALAEMEVPASYLESLPKSGRACLGGVIYRWITSENFSPEYLLDCLDLSSEHGVLEIANQIEAAIHVWRRRQQNQKPALESQSSRSSWDIVKDLMLTGDKCQVLAGRGESLLLSLKQRFPGLPQTALDTSKIQCNKDVGKAILESYSRVLESIAFSIVARIEDLFYVDDIDKKPDKVMSLTRVDFISHKKTSSLDSLPVSGSKLILSTAHLADRISDDKKTNSGKPPRHGLSVRKAISNYLIGDAKPKISCQMSPSPSL